MTEKGCSKHSTLYGIVLTVLAFLAFSSADAFIKELGQRYQAGQVLFFSQVFACLFLTLCIGVRREPVALFPNNKIVVGVRCLAVALGSVCFIYAFTLIPMAQVYVINFATPALITVLAIPLLGERIGVWRTVALVLGFVGVVIVLNPNAVSGVGFGHVMAVVGMVLNAIAYIVIRKVRGTENALTMVFYPCMSMIVVGAFMMGIESDDLPPVAMFDVLLFAVMGVCHMGANLLLVRAFTVAEASLLAPLQYTQLLWAILFGTFIFKEQIPDTVYMGFPFIVASGLLIVWREYKAKGTHHA